MSQFFDLEQEKTALAYALATAETCGEAMSSLAPTLLEDTRHQRIWQAARLYYVQYGGVLDKAGLEAILQKNECPPDRQIMYLALLDDIRGRVVTQPQYKVSLELLEDLRFKRGLYDLVNSTAARLQKGSIDRKATCNEIVASVMELQSSGALQNKDVSYKETLKSRQDLYRERQRNPEKFKGIPYGIKALDGLTGGVRKGELALIMGRPGGGKSALVHNMAYYNAQQGNNSIIFTIEMPEEQESRRLDSRHLQISARGLRNTDLSPEEEAKFLNSASINLSGDIFVVDMPQGCSMAQMLPIIRRHKMKSKVDLILIDYLNLMEPNRWSNSKVERTGDISRELKMLARLEDLPVVTPVRATRESIKAEDDIGTEHASWSDSLGYDADQMLYLKKSTMANALEGQLDAMVVKFRDGSNESIKLGFNWDKSFLGDIDEILAGYQQKLEA